MNVRISARRRHCRSALARERLYRVRHHRDGSTVNPSIRRARSSFEPETRLIPQADPVVAGPGQSEPHPATTPSTRADPDPACACRCLRLGYSSTLMTMPRGTPAPASWPLCRCFAAGGGSRRPSTALSGETSSGQRITQRRRERRASRLGYLCHGLTRTSRPRCRTRVTSTAVFRCTCTRCLPAPPARPAPKETLQWTAPARPGLRRGVDQPRAAMTVISTRVPGARAACTQARWGQLSGPPIHSHHSASISALCAMSVR